MVYRRRSGICWTCQETAAWDYYHRAILTRTTWINEDGVRVRICLDCEEVKPLASGFYVMQKAGTRDSRGHRVCTPRYSRKCRICHNADGDKKRKAAEGARARRIKRQRAEATKRWRERHPDRYKRSKRKAMEKMKADPVRHAKFLEDRRIAYRLKHGEDVRSARPRVSQQESPSFLPVGPIEQLVTARVEVRRTVDRLLGFDSLPGVIGEVCNELGVEERSYFAWRKGERDSLRIGQAERIIARAGVDWTDVYSFDDYAAHFLGVEVAAEVQS